MTEAVGDRVGQLVADAHVVLLHGPAEFLLPDVGRQVVERRLESSVTLEVGDDESASQARSLLRGPDAVLLLLTDPSAAKLLDVALGDAAAPFVLVVEVADESVAVESMAFDLVLGPRELVLDAAAMAALDPALAVPRAHPDTSGVPHLVVGLLDGSAPALARAWAVRVVDAVLADPLLALHIRTGPLPDETIVHLASHQLGRDVTLAEVEAVRDDPLFTLVWRGRRGMPRLLATALRELRLEREPEHRADHAVMLTDLMTSDDRLSGLDRLSVLTTLRAWPEVDRLLASRLHVLTHLSDEERTDYVTRWPARIPRTLPHLAAARAFVDGLPPASRVSPGTPPEWVELAFLAARQDRRQDSPAVATLARWFAPLGVHGVPLPLADARASAERGAEVLLQASYSLLDDGPDTRPDDAALVIGLLGAMFDYACATGTMNLAHRCSRMALRLALELGRLVERYSTLWAGVLARAALLAARAGLPRLAEQHLAEYDRRIEHGTSPRIATIAAIARQFGQLRPQYLETEQVLKPVDVHLPLASLSAEAEAMRIALVNGREAAVAWARQTASRANWNNSPRWEWWPVYQLLALLEAQAGRVSLARSWMGMTDLGLVQGYTVRAALELAHGRAPQALDLAERAIAVAEDCNLGRVFAVGVKLACLAELPARRAELQAVLGSEPWQDMLGAVALFPKNALVMVAGQLGGLADSLPGLQAVEAAAGQQRDVKLTPRQLDVLKALSTGATMGEIARQLFVSVETVRSTAKELYRRLGVHDRDEAVSVAQSLGLLAG